jgi:hypothetical protein
MFCPNLGE